MRHLWAAVLALTLVVPGLRADDKSKAGEKPGADAAKAPETPAGKFREISGQFDKALQEAIGAHRAAKDAKERDAARDKAFALPKAYAVRMIALADAHPKDPVAAEALIWTATIGSRGLPAPPEAKAAADRLLKDYIDSDAIGQLALAVAETEGGEATIRTIREKTKNPTAKVLAGFALANALRESEDQTEAKGKEAETILVEVAAAAKDAKGLPDDLKNEVSRLLDEVRTLSVGKSAPVAESTDLDGKPAKLADHAGKVVVLDFWATWCGPCRGMIPHERELVKKHAGKPFVFISVSADDKKETLQKFMETEKMPWVHWWAGPSGGLTEKWFIKGFPTFYVIDAKGVIRGRIVGGGKEAEQRIESLVDRLVKEASPKSE